MTAPAHLCTLACHRSHLALRHRPGRGCSARLAIFFAIVSTGRYWLGKPAPIAANLALHQRSLPLYAFYSIVRIGIAYLLSLIFAIAYGYIAAYNPRIEAWMIAVLDILQSIPVLSFLPPVVLAWSP